MITNTSEEETLELLEPTFYFWKSPSSNLKNKMNVSNVGLFSDLMSNGLEITGNRLQKESLLTERSEAPLCLSMASSISAG